MHLGWPRPQASSSSLSSATQALAAQLSSLWALACASKPSALRPCSLLYADQWYATTLACRGVEARDTVQGDISGAVTVACTFQPATLPLVRSSAHALLTPRPCCWVWRLLTAAACSPPMCVQESAPRTAPVVYARVGLKGCGLTTTAPGTWYLDYKVSTYK